MDPSIMKLLEEDEDETMHSGADVDAFTAALNRDIEGDNSTPQPSDSDSAAISQGSSNTSSQFHAQWQPLSNSESATCHYPDGTRQQEQHLSEVELNKHLSGTDNRQQQENPLHMFSHSPLQHEPSSKGTSEQLQTDLDTPQVSQGVHESDGTPNIKVETENGRLQSMSNHQVQATGISQSAMTTGMSNQPNTATVMNNQQGVATGVSDCKPMATLMSNQQLMGTGMNNQQLVEMGLSHQQLTTTGMSSQQTMAIGMSNQQSITSGLSGQQSMAMGMSNQQPVTSGINNQQSMTSGMSSQQGMAAGLSNQQQAMGEGMNNQQAVNAMNRGKQVPFALLLPVILPQLDKDRALQLQTLYQKLKKNEVSKDAFVRHMRSIVGDHMLKVAVYKLQAQPARNSRPVPSQQQMQVPPNETNNSTMDTNALQQREVDLQGESHGFQASQVSSSGLNTSSQERDRPGFPVQGLSKQQQHLHFSQASFPTFGTSGSNYHHFPTSTVATSAASLKQQVHDSQMRQHIPAHQSTNSTQSINMTSAAKFERQNPLNEPKRMQGGTVTHMTNNSQLQQNAVQWHPSNEQRNGVPASMTYVKQEPLDQSNDYQRKSQTLTQGLSSYPSVQNDHGNANPGSFKDESFDMQPSVHGFSSAMSIVPSPPVSSMTSSHIDHNHSLSTRIPSLPSTSTLTNNAKIPLKKPPLGQKKPLEALGSSPPPSSKKQKVSGGFLETVEQLNDVTAVSGVNLREEEEQLFSMTKDESRVSEASQRVVQEEEERLILQKNPLQKRLAEIMAKCGLKGIGGDVEKCLSLCVEERMRGLISNLIRLSKQRIDIEKPRHRTIITSDVRQQIMAINRKAREEWEKKQADAEKLQRLNDPEGNNGVDGEKDKDDGRGKSVNKEEDNKMRATAANVAARKASGGDDMLSKWQLMAEKGRQKREGGPDAASGSQVGKDSTRKSLTTSGRSAMDRQQAETRGQSASNTGSGSMRKVGKNQAIAPQSRVARSISVKDVIAVLEREPQMSKTTLMYRLFEKVRSGGTTE